MQGGTNEISELADSKTLDTQSIAKDLQTNSKNACKTYCKKIAIQIQIQIQIQIHIQIQNQRKD